MRIHQTWRGPLVCLALYALLLVGLIYSCGHFPEANGQTFAMPGDTIRVVGVARDSQGVAVVPDAARLFVMRDGTIIDSSKAYPGSGLTVISNWNKALQGIYVVSGAGTFPIDLQFLMRYNWEGFLGDQADVTPSVVRINPRVKNVDLVAVTTEITETITATIGAVDSIAPSAAEDLFQGFETNESFNINTTAAAFADLRVMYLDSPAPRGTVYLTNDADLHVADGPDKNVRVETKISNGHWRAKVPLHHALPDTVYMWAFIGSVWPVEGEMIVMEED